MRRLVLLIVALATFMPTLAQAYDVLVLQSTHNPACDEVLKGFNATGKYSQRLIVISDYAEVDVTRLDREDQPKLVLTRGDAALAAARQLRQTPVLALMSMDSNHLAPNVSIISMLADPDRYCRLLKKLKVRRAGIIFDPAKTGWYLKRARIAAEKTGLELVERKISASRDTLHQLSSLSGKVDALWILPDVTAITQETIEGFFLFGLEQAIPVVSFADKHLGLGAAAVIKTDLTELGYQAGDMAAALLKRGIAPETALVFPRGTTYKTNPTVLEKLGHTNLE